MDLSLWAPVVAALFGGGAVSGIVSAILQRKKVGADATVVITAAARELVDPLRKELALERQEHSAEVEAERVKVKQVRKELSEALEEARVLRNELAAARVDADALRREREKDHARIRELEVQLDTWGKR